MKRSSHGLRCKRDKGDVPLGARIPEAEDSLYISNFKLLYDEAFGDVEFEFDVDGTASDE